MTLISRPRMVRISELFGETLVAAVVERESQHIEAQALLQRFAEADPSRNKSATQWLVKCYLAEGFRLEDLGKASDTVTAFFQHRKRLPNKGRNLENYRTLADLLAVVKPFVAGDSEPVTGRAAKRLERERARAQSDILFEGDNGFTVVVPMTEEAARWWGRGTRWCTAADKSNAFRDYHKRGPLIVSVLPDGTKVQTFAGPYGFQMANEEDGRVSQDVILKNWTYFKPIMRWVAGQNRMTMVGLPRHFASWDAFWSGGRQSETPMSVSDHAENPRSREMYEALVSMDPMTLSLVPKQFKDRDMSLIAVSEAGMALADVPAEFRDREMCRIAIKNNGASLGCVPKDLRDYDMCREAVSNNGFALDYVPKSFRSVAMCVQAIKNSGNGLKHIPEGMLTRELCLEAVRKNGFALSRVPERWVDSEMCLEAVKNNGEALLVVPDAIRTEKICLSAVRNFGGCLIFVPQNLRTKEICLAAVQRSPHVLSDLSQSMKDELGFTTNDVPWKASILEGLRRGLRTTASLRQ